MRKILALPAVLAVLALAPLAGATSFVQPATTGVAWPLSEMPTCWNHGYNAVFLTPQCAGGSHTWAVPITVPWSNGSTSLLTFAETYSPHAADSGCLQTVAVDYQGFYAAATPVLCVSNIVGGRNSSLGSVWVPSAGTAFVNFVSQPGAQSTGVQLATAWVNY